MGWSSQQTRPRLSLGHALVLTFTIQQVLAAAPLGSPAAAYLAQNNGKFKQMLSAVSVDDKAVDAMHGILLAPSDAAVESLASSMGMSVQQLLKNPLLVDQITAYHFMPKVNIAKGLKPANVPLITKTAEPHYVVRFYKDTNSNKAWLLDMQGNKVPLTRKPVVFGNLTIVPVDKVLLSGSYFKSFEDALRLHAQLGKAHELYKRANGLATASAAADTTLFVPVDKAFEASKVSATTLSQPDSRRVLQYHAVPSAKSAAQLQSGSKATLLSGHDVKIDSTQGVEVKEPWRPDKTVRKPAVTLTDEAGNKADVTLFNIWAGQGVIHGINKVLQPTAASTSSDKTAVPAPSKTGSRRHLMQLFTQASLGHAVASEDSSSLAFNRPASRKLLQSGVAPDWGQSNPASALLAANTVSAAYAANTKFQNAYTSLPDSPGWSPMNQWSDWEANA